MIRLRRDANALTSIRFVDKLVPSIGAGNFTITAKPDLTWSDGNRSYPAATEKLRVEGPRFALPEGDVESVFPPATRGMFEESLPNIAFFEPALPWERDIGGGISRSTHPWLALLLFTEDELILEEDPGNDTRRTARKVRGLVTPPAGTLGPQIQVEAAELDGDCFTIDITQETFAGVVPFKDDLPYLAHCRKIDVSGKITEILGDGWFSVIVANRFPPSPATKPNHVVHLVSLEGFAPHLAPNRQWPPAGISRVRLASLHAWRFVCEPSKGNFNDLALQLVRNATAGGEELRLRTPAPAGSGDAADKVKKAMERGYVPVSYDTRSGETSLAWYHGPFVPNPIRNFTPSSHWPPSTSNAALIYDENSGTFDVSYAAAWQLGRLFALSSRIYAGDMARLRQRLKRSVDRLRERGASKMLASNANAGVSTMEAMLDPRHEANAFGEWMADALSPLLTAPPPAQKAEADQQLMTAEQPRDPVEETLALTSHALVQSVMMNVARSAMAGEPGSRIPEWESRLRLLRSVPFAYLVPEVRTASQEDPGALMLPIDSVRFFYVDNNWVDALVAGARSVGVDSSRALAEQGIVAGLIHDAAHDRALAHRPALLGNEPPPRVEESGGPAVTGFVLRSAMVSGWDGLEIEGFKAGSPAKKVNLVRCDRYGDVMIALFDDRVDRVTIAEPKEVLAFGVRNNSGTLSVALRRVTGNVAEFITRKTMGSEFRRPSGALKVNEWQDALRRDPQLNPPQWGSAAFALQMIRVPLKLTFYNPLLPPEGGQ